MDSDPPPRISGSALVAPEAAKGRSTTQPSSRNGGLSADPYSSGSLFHSMAPLLGAVIGLGTLVLPLASVITSREHHGADSSAPGPSTATRTHGLAQPAGLAGSRPGQSAGGDSRRQQQ